MWNWKWNWKTYIDQSPDGAHVEDGQHALVHRAAVEAAVAVKQLAVEGEADERVDVDEDGTVDKHP